MRILVTGSAGRLGSKLHDLLQAEHMVTGLSSGDLDVTDFPAVRDYVMSVKPDLVLHPAAWTDVDGCAREPDKALRINAYGAQNVAIAANAVDAAFLFVSTNEVFDGTQSNPYHEYDRTGAVNPYGASKEAGERAVKEVNPRHYVVRTAWLFAHGGKNFLHSILNAAGAGKQLRVVTDEVANPSYNDDLAEAITRLIATGRYGTYHLTNAGAVSRYAFARYALDRAGYADVPIEPITTREWPRPSTPPKYAALANTTAASLGIQMRPWQEAVDAFLQREGHLKV